MHSSWLKNLWPEAGSTSKLEGIPCPSEDRDGSFFHRGVCVCDGETVKPVLLGMLCLVMRKPKRIAIFYYLYDTL